MSQPESLQSWFSKQGIKHLWSEAVEESEEVLMLLAAEKQWDDIREICSNDLKLPKIKIAYLKAYLIKRTKHLANVTEVSEPTISADTEEVGNDVVVASDDQEDDQVEDEDGSSDNESQQEPPPSTTHHKRTEKKSPPPTVTKSMSKKKKRNKRRRRNQKSKGDHKKDDTPKSSISASTDNVKSNSHKKKHKTSTSSNANRHSDQSSKASKTTTVPDDEEEESPDPSEILLNQCIEYINSIDVGDQNQRDSTYLHNGFEYNEIPVFNSASSVTDLKDYGNMIKEGKSQILRTEVTWKSLGDDDSLWNTLMAMDGRRALFDVKSCHRTHFR